jgi:hypothetical protein
MIDFEQLLITSDLVSDENLKRLTRDQSVLWTGIESWVVLPVTNNSFEAIATSWEAVRQMVEALVAAIGPDESVTLSDFVEKNMSGGIALVAPLQLGETRMNKVLEELQLLVHVRRGQPKVSRSEVDGLNALIRDFFLCLGNMSRDGAENCLRLISLNGRLRQENWRFLQLQMLAHFSEWQAIRNSEDFRDLTLMRTPLVVGTILLEAIWVCDVSDMAEKSSPRALREFFDSTDISTQFGSLFETVVVPTTVRSRRLLALYLAAKGMQSRLDDLLSRVTIVEADRIQNLVGAAGPNSLTPVVPSLSTPTLADQFLAGQYVSVINAAVAQTATAEALKWAFEAALELEDAGLSAQVIQWADASAVDFEALKVLGRLRDRLRLRIESACNDWLEWVKRVNGESISDGSLLIERMPTWSTDWLDSASETSKFVDGLFNAYGGPNSEHIEQSFGLIVGMFRDNYDRLYASELRHPILLIIENLGERNRHARGLALLVVETLIGEGCLIAVYRESISVFRNIWSKVKSPEQLWWISEVIDLLSFLPVADTVEYENFRVNIANDLANMITLIPNIWYDSLKNSLGDLLIDRGSTVIAIGTDWNAISSQKIGIYSLLPDVVTISHYLQKLAPGVEVVINQDSVSSDHLKNMARSCDVVFMQISRAKHSATNAIREHILGKLIVVHGRSRASVLRSIEEYAETLSSN